MIYRRGYINSQATCFSPVEVNIIMGQGADQRLEIRLVLPAIVSDKLNTKQLLVECLKDRAFDSADCL